MGPAGRPGRSFTNPSVQTPLQIVAASDSSLLSARAFNAKRICADVFPDCCAKAFYKVVSGVFHQLSALVRFDSIGPIVHR